MENSSLENMNENFAALKALTLLRLNLFCAWFSFVSCVIPEKFGKGGVHGFAWVWSGSSGWTDCVSSLHVNAELK